MPIQIKKLGVFLLGIISFVLDRLIKNAFYNHSLISNSRWLNYTQNCGIAFGLNLPKVFLIILNIFLLLLLTAWLIKNWKSNNKFAAGLIFLIVLGGYSNLIDRFNFGFVIDYIDLKIFYNNLADVYIFIGIFLLIFNEMKKKSD